MGELLYGQNRLVIPTVLVYVTLNIAKNRFRGSCHNPNYVYYVNNILSLKNQFFDIYIYYTEGLEMYQNSLSV